MNKKFSKILALAIALIMCVAMAIPAFAETPESTENSGSITINKNLIMDSAANVPADAEFEFTLSAKGGTFTAPDYDGTLLPAVTTYKPKFTGSEEPKPGVPNNADNTSKKYATASFTIDFADVTYEKPGVYHYLLTETAPSAPYSSSGSTSLDINVYVVYNETRNQIEIAGVFAGTDDKKSGSFDNEYTTYDLMVKKTVSGNQGDRNEYFKFTVSIDSCPVNGTYSVDTANGNSYTSETDPPTKNPTSITVANGEGSADFYLKSGEYVTVKELPVGTKYTVSEVNGNYTATYVVTENGTEIVASTPGNSYAEADGLAGDTNVTINNHREGIVPTGILMTVAPFAALMVIGIAGVLFIVLKKRSNVQ